MVEISEIFSDSRGLIWAFIGLFSLFTLTWLISIPLVNVGIIDIIWGLTFVLQALIHFFYYSRNSTSPCWPTVVYAGLIVLHGLRLSIYLAVRNCGKPEDRRYKILFRDKYGDKYSWLSYFVTFWPQLIISFIVGFVIFSFLTITDVNKINIPTFLVGAIIMFLATMYESVADQQLYNFKKNPENKGKVLDSGLWYYCRHPNYFSESVFWFGTYIVSLSAVIYYCIFAPALMIVFVNFVSGTPITEKTMSNGRSEEYKKYIRTTSTYFPWFKLKDKEEIEHTQVKNVDSSNNNAISSL